MGKVTGKTGVQWCIKETYLNEVLAAMPKELSIDRITFEVGFSLKRIVSNIPQRLRNLGVTYLREPSASMEAQGVLVGSRGVIEAKAQEICKTLGLDYRRVRVRRMQLSYKGTRVFFTSMCKTMDTGDDNRTYKLRVLGFVKAEGTQAGTDAILDLLTAKKFKCQYSIQTLTTVLCSE